MWKKEYSEIFIKEMKSPFKVKETSTKTKSADIRESNPDNFISKIKSQIIDTLNIVSIESLTPEEWDRCFYELGGGVSRRKSYTILERFEWEEFKNICKNLINTD